MLKAYKSLDYLRDVLEDNVITSFTNKSSPKKEFVPTKVVFPDNTPLTLVAR